MLYDAAHSFHSSWQSSSVFLDRFWGLGEDHYELMQGYDCPIASTSLGIDIYQPGGPKRRK
jgi:hypothetical protein